MQGFYFLTVLALIVVPSLAEKTSWHGKSCVAANGAVDCETTTTGLICSNDKCICAVSQYPKMEFYPATGKCVLPVGAPCTLAHPASDRITPNAICTSEGKVACTTGYTASGKRCLKSTGPCTSDSDCNEDAFETCEGLAELPANAKCGCSAGSQWINNACQLNTDQSCSAAESYPSKACNEVAHLKCLGNKCTCEPRGHDIWFDNIIKKCAIRAEASCIPWEDEQPCVSNAKCQGTAPSTGVCKCEAGSNPNEDWLCKLAHGVKCTPASDFCDTKTHQKCIQDGAGSRCGCVEPAKMNFDYEDKKCKYKAGEKCNPNSGPGCVLNSQCKKVGNDNICVCDGALSKNDKGNCVGKPGATCTTQLECDFYNFLICSKNKKCECLAPSSMEYDAKKQKCYSKLGASCAADGPECKPDSLECFGGRCSCSTKLCLISNGKGACVKSYNATCTKDDPFKCNAADNMECLKGQCKCNKNYIYRSDFPDKLCLGRFETPCNGTTDCDEQSLLICDEKTMKCGCSAGRKFDTKTAKCPRNGAAQFAVPFGMVLLSFVVYLKITY